MANGSQWRLLLPVVASGGQLWLLLPVVASSGALYCPLVASGGCSLTSAAAWVPRQCFSDAFSSAVVGAVTVLTSQLNVCR